MGARSNVDRRAGGDRLGVRAQLTDQGGDRRNGADGAHGGGRDVEEIALALIDALLRPGPMRSHSPCRHLQLLHVAAGMLPAGLAARTAPHRKEKAPDIDGSRVSPRRTMRPEVAFRVLWHRRQGLSIASFRGRLTFPKKRTPRARREAADGTRRVDEGVAGRRARAKDRRGHADPIARLEPAEIAALPVGLALMRDLWAPARNPIDPLCRAS